MTEKQLKYMNKVKARSFFILVAGLLLVLAWSIMKNKVAKTPETPQTEAKVLAINYEIDGTTGKYDYTCATQDCILATAQTGSYAIVKDGAYKLVNIVNKTTKELTLPTMTKSFIIAGEDFYGLVYTSDDTNKASFYEASTNNSLYSQELNYEKMNDTAVREVLNKMYPRKMLYLIKDETATVLNLETKEAILENVKAMFYYENELYGINDKGLNLFKEDNTVEEKITGVKEVYNAMYKENIVILDTDNKIKTSTLAGVKGEGILDITTNTVESITVQNGVLKIILKDKDYDTNQKLVKYEYDFETKKLNPIESN